MLSDDRLVIWDCDGVLVDSELLGAMAFGEIIRSYGVDIDDQTVLKALKGGNIHVSLEYVSALTGESDLMKLERRFRERSFELFNSELLPIEGVAEVIPKISNHRCVASNGPKTKILKNLEITGLKKFFSDDNIFSGHDIGSFKPEPDLFLHAAGTLGFTPDQCVVIEDSLHGAEAAEKAGITCFLYSHDEEVNGNFISFGAMCDLLELVQSVCSR